MQTVTAMSNYFVPAGLPLLSDHVLIGTYQSYSEACAELRTEDLSEEPAVRSLLRELIEALGACEAELHARGLGASPWWGGKNRPITPARLSCVA